MTDRPEASPTAGDMRTPDALPPGADHPDVLVAGAGVAGLACGAVLAGLGLRVVVCEQEPECGGRAASWTDLATGDRVDIGPHVLSSEHRNFMALLRLLGTEGEVLWQRSPLATLLDAGRVLRMFCPPLPPPLHGLANLPQALRSVSIADLASNTRVAWHAARADEAYTRSLDGTDAHRWLLQMGVTPRCIDWFWRSSMLSLLNLPLERCSAAAAMRVFRLMLGRSGYHFGFPRIPLADLFVGACVSRIEAAGGAVLRSCAVQDVMSEGGRFRGFRLKDGRRLEARAGVLALPPQGLESLPAVSCGPLSALAGSAARFEPVPYVSTMLFFDHKVTSERFWARVYSPSDLNTDFYDLSNIRSDRGAESPSWIVANSICAREQWNWSDERLVEQTAAEIADFAPSSRQAKILHARIHRIPMAVPGPLPGSEGARPKQSTALAGLWLAGDWTDTSIPCSMESAARSGFLAAEAVAAAAGHPCHMAVPPPETVGLPALLRRWFPIAGTALR